MEPILISRWVLAVLFGLFWFVCAAGNLGSIIGAARRRGSTSLNLIFGGVAGMIAVLVCPIPGLWVWCWVPALLDVGTLPALAAMTIRGVFTRHSNPSRTTDHNA